jgi:hypothetical protein
MLEAATPKRLSKSHHLALSSARLAVELMREKPFSHPREVAADALALTSAAVRSRDTGIWTEEEQAALQPVADKYYTLIIAPLNRDGMWIGLRWSGPNHARLVQPLAEIEDLRVQPNRVRRNYAVKSAQRQLV